jgi:phosphatidylserine/phosphatidylglycerophosphate/cardiolipin synthase-like enzyme
MEKFIRPENILSEICSIAFEAKNRLVIACPFINLHHNFKRSIKSQISNNNLQITIIYGKFSQKSDYEMTKEDLDFLQDFPRIKIYYNKRLHAKYYANETKSIVSSLNLNHTSSNNNLEYGIRLNNQSNKVALELKNFFDEIIEESELVFESKREIANKIIDEKNEKNGYHKNLQRIKKQYINAYERWTSGDDEKLEKLFCEGKKIKELSGIFMRQPSAIRARINKLELKEKYF